MANIDYLNKVKKDDGSWDVLYPITKPENVKTAEKITVMLPEGESVGSYVNGDVIDIDTAMSAVIKKMLQVQVPPTYTAPTISISTSGTNKAGSYEAGENLTATITSKFTQNDAGAITKHAILQNGTEVASGTDATMTYDASFQIGDGSNNVKFTSNCAYEAGAIKKDNFEEDYPTGAIAAGNKTATSGANYSGYRKYFYASDNGTAAVATSDEVRALETASTSAMTAGKKITINVAEGDGRVTIAYDASIRDLTQVFYVEANDPGYASFFTKTTVDVEGANGYTAKSYKVYTWIPDSVTFPADMTLEITI